MSATIIDGKAFAAGVRTRVAGHVAELAAQGIVPGLAVVLVGDDPASATYVRTKGVHAEAAGMASFQHRLPESTPEGELLALIARLNADTQVHGILVQRPLPAAIDSGTIADALAPSKDIDGFHISNVGRLGTGQRAMVPSTPLGCLMLLRHHLGSLAGREAVVLGRTGMIGRPMAQLLTDEGCTVTLAHSKTRDLPAVAARGDIVIAALGRPEMVTGDWLKPGATVIDVGINRVADDTGKTRIVGDVHLESAAEVAGVITPVPGGVGPVTIAFILANTLAACCRIHGLPDPEGLTVGA
jgi:methylenetetrahydrofolate dehydrogenase (NADP+) / methenyltetrahydrofolate cyclohydrolase